MKQRIERGDERQPQKPVDLTEPHDKSPNPPAKEIGGRPGPDPTRYGDWEKNGRCIDF